MKVVVIGAGINGSACAVKIKEKYKNDHVVVISSEFSPNTTGDGSGGLWYPYLCGDTPEHLLDKWGIESYNFLHQLWREGGYDICLVPVFNLFRDKGNCRRPSWADKVFGFHALTDRELEYCNTLFSVPYTAGHSFSSFVYTPSIFLRYLYQRFKESGGEFRQAKVNSLRDPILDEFDVVVNCTGLNAKYVTPDDAVFPYRGQVTKVIAPWVNFTVMDEDKGNYIIPNVAWCVLGGTRQRHAYSTRVDAADARDIMRGCARHMPTLQSAAIHSQWVGLRPGRDRVRVEAEMLDEKHLIHNYGHGGCGLTLFWGCATDVLQQLEHHMTNNFMEKCKL